VSDTAFSRRMSEFVGVVLFALALIWVISLGSYSSADPVWFFKNVASGLPTNFAGRVGAFTAEASYQLLGYSAWAIPFLLGFAGWHAFWCHRLEAAYTKASGAVLMVVSLGGLLALAFRALDGGPRAFPAGGVFGDWAASGLAEYLNRTGATILLIVLLVLSVILSTQFSFGRAAAALGRLAHAQGSGLTGRWREWRDQRRRDQERKQIIDKHVKKAGRDRAPEIATKAAGAAASLKAARAKMPVGVDADEDDASDGEEDARVSPVRDIRPPARRASMMRRRLSRRGDSS